MGRPLDEPSKIFGLMTMVDAFIVILFLFAGSLILIAMVNHGVRFPLAVCFLCAFIGPPMAYMIVKNTLPDGFFYFYFKFRKKPKILLPEAETLRSKGKKNASY